MWVRAQIDYLQRLPNDWEKRQALKRLPPDLPQTYIRIFEKIESAYPVQTTRYVQRLLQWLVFKISYGSPPSICTSLRTPSDTLRLAICIDNEHDWPTSETIPTLDQVHRWLGCLIRMTEDGIELSHFTVREFLVQKSEVTSHSLAQKYLVDPQDCSYIVHVCMTYLMHSHFRDTQYSNWGEIDLFISDNPLYAYIAKSIFDHLSGFDDSDVQDNHPIRRFISDPPCWRFELWEFCNIRLEEMAASTEHMVDQGTTDEPLVLLLSPLDFVALAGLRKQMQRLLRECADQDISDAFWDNSLMPLHHAIASGSRGAVYMNELGVNLAISSGDVEVDDEDCTKKQQRSLHTATMLVNSGADVNRQAYISLNDNGTIYPHVCIAPSVVAVISGNWKLVSFLLDAGADWEVTTDTVLGYSKFSSVKDLLKRFPRFEDGVRLAAQHSGHNALMKALEDWTPQYDANTSGSRSTSPSTDDSVDPQNFFIDAFSNGNWQDVRELLTKHPNLDLDCPNEHGYSAVYYAAVGEEDGLECLLEHGANPDRVQGAGFTALYYATEAGYLENMGLLLRSGANIEHRAPDGWTPLLVTVHAQRFDALQLLLDAGANVNATLDSGCNALHIAVDGAYTEMFDFLLKSGVNPNISDNYGSTPLHMVCSRGLESQIEQLVALMEGSINNLDHDSLIAGTPLYAATAERCVPIMKLLLDHGATIDKSSPGNLLGSALMVACAQGHCAAVRLLLSRRAALVVDGARFGSAEGTARASERKRY